MESVAALCGLFLALTAIGTSADSPIGKGVLWQPWCVNDTLYAAVQIDPSTTEVNIDPLKFPLIHTYYPGPLMPFSPVISLPGGPVGADNGAISFYRDWDMQLKPLRANLPVVGEVPITVQLSQDGKYVFALYPADVEGNYVLYRVRVSDGTASPGITIPLPLIGPMPSFPHPSVADNAVIMFVDSRRNVKFFTLDLNTGNLTTLAIGQLPPGYDDGPDNGPSLVEGHVYFLMSPDRRRNRLTSLSWADVQSGTIQWKFAATIPCENILVNLCYPAPSVPLAYEPVVKAFIVPWVVEAPHAKHTFSILQIALDGTVRQQTVLNYTKYQTEPTDMEWPANTFLYFPKK